ncbi:hypothetical protein HK098_007750 [Nowakowskiella sp. JEL0407]|nr:hypothetical protein HK098_007750 [Nowakowskiella sp. JEL0407]
MVVTGNSCKLLDIGGKENKVSGSNRSDAGENIDVAGEYRLVETVGRRSREEYKLADVGEGVETLNFC